MNVLELTCKYIDYKINTDDSISSISLEYPFNSFTRKADVLLLYPEVTYAVEIKSKRDNLLTIRNQVEDYCKSFNYVDVLVDSIHFPEVLKYIDKNVGVVIFDGVDFKRYRKARKKARLDKKSLLSFFGKNELLKRFSSAKKLRNEDTNTIRNVLVENESIQYISSQTIEYLKMITKDNYELFLHDRGGYTLKDDLLILSRKGKHFR